MDREKITTTFHGDEILEHDQYHLRLTQNTPLLPGWQTGKYAATDEKRSPLSSFEAECFCTAVMVGSLVHVLKRSVTPTLRSTMIAV